MIQFVTRKCMVCGQNSMVELDEEQYYKWQFEELFVQDAFPDMSAGEREMLITGTHPACWDSAFPPEEEEELNYDVL